MEILWKRSPATVSDVVEALPRRLGLAYSTVLTTMRILDRKGHVRHEKQGRAFRYYPVLQRTEARRRVIRYMLSRFFNDSPELLVLNVLEHEDLDRAEIARILEKIEEMPEPPS
jgi:predicted transcriptional regulator